MTRMQKGLCLLLIFSLLGCALLGCKRKNKDTEKTVIPGEDPTQKESALNVAAAARDFLSSVTSYRETVTTKLSFPYQGGTLVVKNTDDSRYYGIGNAESFYCEQTTSQLLSLGSAEDRQTVQSGYQNGKMYLSDGEISLCSPLTAEEYVSYLAFQVEQQNYLSELEDSEKVGYRQDGDGYVITFTDVAEEKLSALKEKFLSLESLVGSAELKNVLVTVTLDAAGRPTETKMEFDFSSSSVSLTVTTAYGEWNAVSSAPSVSLASYRETGDLRKISEVSDALNALKQQSELRFTLTENTVKDVGGSLSSSAERYQVEVSDQPSYAYTIRQTTSAGAVLDFTYRNGAEECVTYLSDKTEFGRTSAEKTESEAKAKITGFLNVGDLSSLGVTDVSVSGNTVTFQCEHPDTADYEEDYSVESASAVLSVTLDGDTIVSFTYILTLDATDCNTAQSVLLTIEKIYTKS